MRFQKKLLVFALFFLSASESVRADSFDRFFTAAMRDDESTVVELTLRGFDLNTRNEKGETGLTLAIRQGSTLVANFLLDQNAVDVNARNAAGETPLMLAAIKGELTLARRLIIDRKAQVNQPGWTPLHYAASSKVPASLEVARLLLEHHAYIDAESPNKTTPLMMAAQYGQYEVLELLLEEGADPSLRNQLGLNAIDFARRAGHEAAARRIAESVRAAQPAGRW
ncbi:MAG: ankyrin repeat domain-containing protein [Gammaproteobacteria bacterium]